MWYSRRSQPVTQHHRRLVRLTLAGLLLLSLACDTKSPTKPDQNPTPPPPGGTVTQGYNITVSVSANQLTVGGTGATVTVNVRRSDTNSAPPNGTTVALSTSLGAFGSAGSGQQQGFVELENGTAQVLFFPGDVVGTAVIRAQVQNDVGSATVQVVAAPEEPGADRFFLDSISPNTGSPNGGEVLRIHGGGFVEPVRVFLGGVFAEVLNVRADQIRVRTPEIQLAVGQSRTVDVSVTNDLNGETQATDTLPGAFTYTRGGTTLQPVILSVTPNLGPNEGGTQVVIQGDGFEPPVQVLFGSGSSGASFSGIEAQVLSATATRIVVSTPAATAFGQINLNDEVDILVRNLNTGSSAVFGNAFRYGVGVLITAISPAEGPYTGGTNVTVFGQGFDEPVAVEMGGVGQSIVSVTGTEIIIRTVGIDPSGCSDVNGQTRVTNIETGDSATGPSFTYRVASLAPRVSSLSPASGDSGDTVTINGSGFTPGMEVLFALPDGGPANAPVTFISSTQVRVKAPALPDSSFLQQSCDDNGDGTAGFRLIDTPVDVTINDTNTTCTTSFRNAFVYESPDNSCQNDDGPPPPASAPPVASFTFSYLSDFEVQFVDTSTGNPGSWSWKFGDTSTSSQQFPTHTYGAPGNYPVTLTVLNDGGSNSTVQVVTVPAPP